MELDDDLIAELLELFEDPTVPISLGGHAQSPSVSSAAFPASLGSLQVTETTRQSSVYSGRKETLHTLREEADALTRELERLRRRLPTAHEHAVLERRKRHIAERECRELRQAVYQHTQFVRGLEALFHFRPRFSLRLNLCRHLHHHVRLPRDRSSRWGDFDPISHDERLHSTMDVLCRETEAMSLTAAPAHSPFFHCEPVDDMDCRSFTSTSIYTIDSDDLGAVARGVCVAVRDVVTLCPLGHNLVVARDIVDDTSVERNILYRILGVRHRNLHSGAEVLLESHVVTSYKITNDYAIVLWDFVDDDQLHPLPDAININHEITGACLIRRELCDDGQARTVVRGLVTKRFQYHECDIPERYGCVSEESMYANELLFRNLVVDQVTAETELLARAHAVIPATGDGSRS